MTVRTLILSGYGINSEDELEQCFLQAGSQVKILHINELIQNPSKMNFFDIVAFAGGFSFGDHISSGKIYANKIKIYFGKQLNQFIGSGKPVIGICNGFQMLVKGGWLPDTESDLHQQATLTKNNKGLFENRWVNLNINDKNNSFWLKGIETLDLPVRHGEGKFVVGDSVIIEKIQTNNQIAFYYADDLGEATMTYPNNPNGSLLSIAGITNKKGNVLGLMPHPECYRLRGHHPNADNWLPNEKQQWTGMSLFQNAVSHVKNIY